MVDWSRYSDYLGNAINESNPGYAWTEGVTLFTFGKLFDACGKGYEWIDDVTSFTLGKLFDASFQVTGESRGVATVYPG